MRWKSFIYIGQMPASKSRKTCTRKSCKLTADSMGHCGAKGCPGMDILDRIHKPEGKRTMKSKATKHKIDENKLREAVINTVGPDASDSDIAAVASAIGKLTFQGPKTSRKTKKRPPPLVLPKSPGVGNQGGRQSRRTRRVRKPSNCLLYTSPSPRD